MIVSLRVAMIDERKPQFEGVNLRARRAVLLKLLKRLTQRCRIFVVALNVDASSERKLYARCGLKR